MEQEEIHNPGGSDRVSIIPYPDTITLAKTFLKENHRKDILDFITKEYKLSVIADNLVSTERTDWHVHKDAKFKPYYDIFLNYLYECMFSINSYPKVSYGGSDNDVNIESIDCWFARCKKGGYTDPHDHGIGIALYSYACYLELPSGTSSITFANNGFEFKKRIMVREGDLLVFPSHLKHWSFDTEENRSLLSGNFIWSVKLQPDDFEENAERKKDDNVVEFIKSNLDVLRVAQDDVVQ
jgi:hypothetical protein